MLSPATGPRSHSPAVTVKLIPKYTAIPVRPYFFSEALRWLRDSQLAGGGVDDDVDGDDMVLVTAGRPQLCTHRC